LSKKYYSTIEKDNSLTAFGEMLTHQDKMFTRILAA